MVKAKRVVLIKPLNNVIELNILKPEIVERYKYSPRDLFMLGVSNLIDTVYRIHQTLEIKKLTGETGKNFILGVFNHIVAQIMKLSIEGENPNAFTEVTDVFTETLNYEITKEDEEFLKQLGFKPGSLK